MKKLIYLLLFISTSCCGCRCQRLNYALVSEYKEGLAFFKKNLINHFPEKFPDDIAELVIQGLRKDTVPMVGFDKHCVCLKVDYSEKAYSLISNKVKDSAKAHYVTTDTSLLLIFSYCNTVMVDGRMFTDTESPAKRQLAARNRTMTGKLPVPSFENTSFSDDRHPTGLDSNYVFYVLDAEPGYFLSTEYLRECEECLPTEWKHGYSKGVALNDKEHTVIYWITVW